ncbi:hypothetical protein BDZ89DRAFT_367589 [Hymenopellis radicata]|nr:hypothetical protein BDZ89DRAFT_367589 [Hymenopellis radicata]
MQAHQLLYSLSILRTPPSSRHLSAHHMPLYHKPLFVPQGSAPLTYTYGLHTRHKHTHILFVDRLIVLYLPSFLLVCTFIHDGAHAQSRVLVAGTESKNVPTLFRRVLESRGSRRKLLQHFGIGSP